MSGINVLGFPKIFDFLQACCDRVCGHAETHVPVMRTPIVSARWTVEIDGDGTQRLIERWLLDK